MALPDNTGRPGRFLSNMSSLNLGRLVKSLIAPDRNLTAAERQLAEYAMDEIVPGTRTQEHPDYQHKPEAKPSVKKSKQHSGRRFAAAR